MAQGNFDPCFKFTIGEEGKYSGNPNDPGNWSSGEVGVGRMIGSCWGISAPVLAAWIGPKVIITQDYMLALSLNTAKAIYLKNYWTPVRGDELPAGLDLAVWDFGVNAGVKRSIEEFQQVLGVTVDGDLGPETMAAAGNIDVGVLIADLIDAHDRFYRASPQREQFGGGWLNRQAALKTAALALI